MSSKRKSTESSNSSIEKKARVADRSSYDYDAKRRNVCKSVLEFKFNKKRVRMVNNVDEIPDNCEAVLYWMFRDQRVQDNWALLYAQKLALKCEKPLVVCFCLPSTYMVATYRQYYFMIEGLKEVEKKLHQLNIPFVVLKGEPPEMLPDFIASKKIGVVVTDFLPLRLPMQWLEDVKDALSDEVSLCQVDAHNVVPCWHASNKQEYSARTIRPKITNKLSEFLTEFPPLVKHGHSASKDLFKKTDWDAIYKFIGVDRSVQPPEWATPGTTGGLAKLEEFIASRLKYFGTQRNDPTKIALSDLSPWMHAGQISAQRAALRVRESRGKYSDSVSSYLEESIVRRELTDNFCYYNENYDSVKGASEWAQKTLQDHAGDKREKVYSKEQFELGKTHDPLWNAAQHQLLIEGKMHGFLRMYWAKKILEWAKSPEEALEIALFLNDKYELDGLDPNGYVGCMWSICGIHDQGWMERPVFGKIRYMNYKGCQRKFDVQAFINKYQALAKKLLPK